MNVPIDARKVRCGAARDISNKSQSVRSGRYKPEGEKLSEIMRAPRRCLSFSRASLPANEAGRYTGGNLKWYGQQS